MVEKRELFEWIKNSTKGLNCLMFGCKNPPISMCLCSYNYCEEHDTDESIPRELDPHTSEFDDKWGVEDLRLFLYEE